MQLLRDYQTNSIQDLKTKIRDGIKRIVLVCPTGSGKTTIAAEIIRMCTANSKSVLFLAHRQELVFQAHARLKQFGVDSGIIMAGNKHNPALVNIASIQTLSKRNKPHADVVIVDECHHGVSTTYQSIISHYSNSIIIGLTATPYRLDGKPLGDIFQAIVEPVTIRFLIDSGYLVEPRYFAPKEQIETSHLKKQHGDFNLQQLFAEADKRILYDGVVANYRKFCNGQRTIVFNVNKQHSRNMRDFFIRDGISAVHLDCDTPAKERRKILEDFKNGLYRILCNVSILCIDTETEILTNKGWTKYNEMTYSHKVANWNFDETIFFKEPRKIIIREILPSEKMVKLKTKQSDIFITNNHNLIFKSSSKCKWKKNKSDSLINKRFIYPSCGISEPEKYNIKIKTNNKYTKSRRIINSTYNLIKNNGYNREEARKEATDRVNKFLELNYKNPDELTLNECKFIGFWLGDGSVNKLIRFGLEYTLSQSKNYPNIIKWIDNLLLSCEIDNIKRDKDSHFVWSLPRGTGRGHQKRNGVFHLEPYLIKNGTELFYGLDKYQIEALIEGLWYADGNHRQANYVPSSKIICSIYHNLLSILQAVLICRGFKANINLTKQHLINEKYKKLWLLSIEKRKHQSVMSKKQEYSLQYFENYTGKVWCVQNDSQNIITRRNGRVCIMGNCEGYDLPAVAGIILNRATASKCLYFQMCGRGLRPHEDKSHCVIIDHGGNIMRFGLLDEEQKHDLFKKQKEKLPGEYPLKVCPECEALIHARRMKCENCGHVFQEIGVNENGDITTRSAEFAEIINFKKVSDIGVIPDRLRKPFTRMNDEELEEYRQIKNYKPGWKYHIRQLRGTL